MPGLLKVAQSSDEEDDVRSSSTMSIISGTSTRRSSVSSLGRHVSGALQRSGSILEKLKRTKSKVPEPESRSSRPFITMNDEIHQAILDGLESVHRAERTCYTCLARDLVAYAGVCKDFCEVGLKRLYSSIFIHGDECSRHRSHSSKAVPASRMRRLRETLEARPEYAEWVVELKVPEYRRDSPPARIATLQMEIADVVSLCPNLEKLLGAQFPLQLMSDGLLHALRNCRNLREHLWLLSSSTGPTPRTSPGSFESFHGSWTQLQTLVMNGDGSSCITEGCITRALRKLPFLQRLMISRFPKTAFSNATLRELPALRALRLEHLPGLTDNGLMSYARSKSVAALESLALIGLQLEKLSTIALVIGGLKQLWSFTLENDVGSLKNTDFCRFESSSLISLHWDIRKPKSSTIETLKDGEAAAETVTAANSALALAIEDGRFPSLRKLRAPSDEGQLQKVCRPRWKIARPTDFVFEFSDDIRSTDPSTASFLPRHHLREARRRAQERVDQAGIKMPIITINIEENGAIKKSQVIRDRSSALGDIESKVFYDLNPDFEDGYPTSSSSAFVGLDEILEQWRLETEPHKSNTCVGAEGRGSTVKRSKRGGHAGSLRHQERSTFFTTRKLGDLFGVVD